MSQEIKTAISKVDDNLQQNNKEEDFSFVVEDLINNDSFKAASASNFITLISRKYNISNDNARNCLKEAIKELENEAATKPIEKEKPKEKLNGESGFFYKNSYSEESASNKDAMDSLCSLASYNRLMFNL